LYNCRVEIINTVVVNTYVVDLLIVDEVHICGSDTFRRVFDSVDYNFILCLTGTLERLDGKEIIIKRYAPVCDIITMQEALDNH